MPKGPCEVCGNPDATNHHDDYSKPREFKRLCRDHHADADKDKQEREWRIRYIEMEKTSVNNA